MTKQKWNEIYIDEVMAYANNSAELTGPQNWTEYKQNLLKFVKNIDEATEIYNMENKGK